MSLYLHTANEGWLEPPSPFAHLPYTVHIQPDRALNSDEWRLYEDGKAFTRTHKIGEHSVSEIRRAIEAHLAKPVEQPASPPAPEPEAVPQLRQATLF